MSYLSALFKFKSHESVKIMGKNASTVSLIDCNFFQFNLFIIYFFLGLLSYCNCVFVLG